MSELTLIDGNFGALAEAMGMSQDIETKAKASTLARLKILHEGVKGVTVIKDKKTEYIAVDAGVYELTLPNGAKIYQKNPKVRLFMQRFMYQRYVSDRGNYTKTVFSTDLKHDLPDTDGGFNCGRQSGYIENFDDLPQEQKEVDRVRTILGEVYFDKALDESGEELDCSKSKGVPFVADFKKEGFKLFEGIVKGVAQKNKLLPQCTIQFDTESREGKSGMVYHVPSLNILEEDVELSKDDQTKFQDFIKWVENYNEGVMVQHEKHSSVDSKEEKTELLSENTTIIEPKKAVSKKTINDVETAKKPSKDLESVMSAWTDSDDAA